MNRDLLMTVYCRVNKISLLQLSERIKMRRLQLTVDAKWHVKIYNHEFSPVWLMCSD